MPINNRNGAKVAPVITPAKPVVKEESKQKEDKTCETKKHLVNNFGVTYYQINDKDDKLYGEDNVEGCGLTNQQIDANFNYLHGDDIKEGKFNKKDKSLTLDRWFKDNDDLRKVAYKHPYTIGPVKISTKGLISAEYDKDGKIMMDVNGEQVEVKGSGERSKAIDEELARIEKILAQNSLKASITLSKSVGEKGVPTNVIVTAKIDTVRPDEKQYSKTCKHITIKQNGVVIASANDIQELKCNVSGLTERADFTTEIEYEVEGGNVIGFTSSTTYNAYYCILTGYYNIKSEKYLQTEKEDPKSSAKNSFYKFDIKDLGEDECYLVFYIPKEIYDNDHPKGDYTFRFNGYGIKFTNDITIHKIDNIDYCFFESEAIYKNDKEYIIQVL